MTDNKIVIAVFTIVFLMLLVTSGLTLDSFKAAHRALVDWCINQWPEGTFVYGMICFCLVTIVSLAFWGWK